LLKLSAREGEPISPVTHGAETGAIKSTPDFWRRFFVRKEKFWHQKNKQKHGIVNMLMLRRSGSLFDNVATKKSSSHYFSSGYCRLLCILQTLVMHSRSGAE